MTAHQIASLFEKAELAQSEGKWHAAENAYLKILSKDSRNPDALYRIAMLHHARGEFNKALNYMNMAIQAVPQFGPLYTNLGIILDSMGKYDEALEAHKKAVALEPGYANAYLNMGNILFRQLRFNEAEQNYRTCLNIDGSVASAWSGLGLVLMHLNRHAESLQAHQQAYKFNPNDALINLNFGHALIHNDDADGAYFHYLKAIDLNSNLAKAESHLGQGHAVSTVGSAYPSPETMQGEAWAYVANSFVRLKKVQPAEAAYKKAISLCPDRSTYLIQFAILLQTQSKQQEAHACYEKAKHTELADIATLRQALMAMPIYPSDEAMQADRARLESEVEQLLARNDLHLHDPIAEWGMTNFFLAYQNKNDATIQRRIAKLNRQVYSSLTWSAPHIASWSKKPAPKRIRIGIISANFYFHTISKLNRGWIEKLDRSRFEPVLLRFSAIHDDVSALLEKAFDRVVNISCGTLAEAQQSIAQEQLDVLFYPDIGMDSLTYFLSYARLAPVQCVTWGHPVTTGIDTVDYFITSKHLEPAGAEEHYTETLVKFDTLPCYYIPPEWNHVKTRQDFGLPEKAHLYIIPQTLFKFHPDYDSILAEILNRDPDAFIVLLQGVYPHWTEMLQARLEKAYAGVSERIRFLPPMPMSDFLTLQTLADALLDPIYFGGGNTTYEALAFGCPIVTWPGSYMRGRVTDGCYRQMGMTDLSVNSREEYIDLAIKLATDKSFQTAMREKVKANSHAVFNTESTVSEFEKFFSEAVAKARA